MQFFLTTLDEEKTSAGEPMHVPAGNFVTLPPGDYRVIDGKLRRILSGLPLDEVRRRLMPNHVERISA